MHSVFSTKLITTEPRTRLLLSHLQLTSQNAFYDPLVAHLIGQTFMLLVDFNARQAVVVDFIHKTHLAACNCILPWTVIYSTLIVTTNVIGLASSDVS